ncbi:aminodeoxychorismate synthase component I [Pseudomonas laurentiana]
MARCRISALQYSADPSRYFSIIANAPGAILLDSGRPECTKGRFDIMSAWPKVRLVPSCGESASDFLARLRSSLAFYGPAEAPDDLPFAGGLLGYLGYDFGRRIETIPSVAKDDLGLADAAFGLYGWAVVTDHRNRTTQLVCHPAVQMGEQQRIIEILTGPVARMDSQSFALMSRFEPDVERDHYQDAIARIHDYIASGDCYQVNYAQRFSAMYEGDPWHAYSRLRKACPTPFSGFIRLSGRDAVLSLSPERFLEVRRDQVEARPIKGTRPRGMCELEDAENALELLSSEKDRAENLMIVDLLRNDLGRNCRVGSVTVPSLFTLEAYPNVHHLVSVVRGELAQGRDALDLLLGAFPGGSITGAPKIRAMEIIDELESTRRGIYCGSLMYLDVRGQMDSSIAIRTMIAKGGKIHCWGGGGIVGDSQWFSEYEESITKVKLLMDTLADSN